MTVPEVQVRLSWVVGVLFLLVGPSVLDNDVDCGGVGVGGGGMLVVLMVAFIPADSLLLIDGLETGTSRMLVRRWEKGRFKLADGEDEDDV